MRETGRVPRRKIPMPQEAEAMRRLAGDAASLVLRELLMIGTPVRRAHLLERLDMHQDTINRGFDELEREGIVVADVPIGQRRGRVPLYAVDRARLAEVQNDYIAWLHGGPGTFAD